MYVIKNIKLLTLSNLEGFGQLDVTREIRQPQTLALIGSPPPITRVFPITRAFILIFKVHKIPHEPSRHALDRAHGEETQGDFEGAKADAHFQSQSQSLFHSPTREQCNQGTEVLTCHTPNITAESSSFLTSCPGRNRVTPFQGAHKITQCLPHLDPIIMC